ncbi:uroporphyrinogen-III C-methyltransferase [Buchnera aphidicola (Melanaphis sacchari)]|uniref:Uroporphyrinogen-III C-methyltransferase n=1 Tax=Buchnera aphidicola (Melanaphis sacchari) TaxID=2173854 RepID=A0A2U8DFX2_9GAMM|nr:siroheme synthase CysG [Buchnera aphidicola]AWH90375.1 uroporphyrinogen-III C-methyltransferase [Buchnera aphidicola (Melanaphis sacchari)]
MDYFPAFLDLKYKNVLVVGAGEVALNKIKLLLRTKAIINIISECICQEIQCFVQRKKVYWISKKFSKIYLKKTYLVIAATNDTKLNQKIFQMCNNACIFVNVVDDQSKCSFIFPSIIDRSPIVLAISSSGKAPILLRLLRQKIESILPSRLGEIAVIAGQWRSVVKNYFTRFLDRRRFWEKLLNGPFSQNVINGNIKKAISILKKTIKQPSVLMGEIILVGAGPGNSDLLTLRALQVLQEADVVLYDCLISKDILDRIRRDAKCICVGKRAGKIIINQTQIIKMLIEFAKEGKKVVRLKGGDPFIFGRGGEELEAAKSAGILVQIVPGITAGIGIAAYTGIPLTHRNYAKGLIFITGHKCIDKFENNWSILSDPNYTLVVYMGSLQIIEISQKLIFYGCKKSTPIALISQGTTINQRVVIGKLGETSNMIKNITTPSLLIIGRVVLLHEKLKWFNLSNRSNNIKNIYSVID